MYVHFPWISLTSLWVEFKNHPKLPFRAVKAAGLNDFTFHDLRHCAINKLRLSGNDYYLIKQISGHKTDIAFQRYNLVTEEEIHRIKWLDKKEEKSGTMDTYMDYQGIIVKSQILCNPLVWLAHQQGLEPRTYWLEVS